MFNWYKGEIYYEISIFTSDLNLGLTSLAMDKDFTISVIIPTLNNQDLVEKIILKLNKQTLLPKEIVICDSS